MPEINDYLPQVQAPEGLGSVSPNIELAGAKGRGLQNLGADIAQGASALERASRQEEVATTYAHMANQRAQWTDQIHEGIKDGSLDVDQMLEQYDHSTDDFGSKLSTAGGKNFFTRQQARLRGDLLGLAKNGMAQVKANQTRGQIQDVFDQLGNTVYKDPTQFDSALNSAQEFADAYGVDAKTKPLLIQKFRSDLSLQALRSTAELDQVQLEDGSKVTGPEAARSLLKSKYGDHLNVQQRKEIDTEIDRIAKGKEVDANNAQRVIEKAQKLTEEKWYTDHFDGIHNGAVSSKDVNQAVHDKLITPDKAEHILNVMDAASKKETKTKPHVYADFLKRLGPDSPNPLSGPDDPDLLKAIAKGDIAIDGPNSAATLNKAFTNMTPEGQAIKRGEAALKKYADTVKFRNDINGTQDARSVNNANSFMSDYYNYKAQYVKNGGKASDLLDPHSKDYFGKNISRYQLSQTEKMAVQADDRTNKALNTGDATGSAPLKPPVKGAKKPGQSIMDNLKENGDI